MKKIMIIMAGLFVLACNNEKDKEAEKKTVFSELEADNMKGDISSIETAPYKTDSTGKIGEMDSCCISVTEYDENGNSTRSVSKDSKGTEKSQSTTTHHPNGLFKSVTNTENGKNKGGFETKIDDKGNYTWAQGLDSNGKMEVYYTEITNNEVGEVTGWKQYNKDSVFVASGEAKYDKNKMLENTIKDSVGTVTSKSSSKYNDKGEEIESSFTRITKDTTTTRVTKYTYELHDEMGNWTQRTTWDDKGKATGITKRTINYRKEEAKK